ncbi:MAG: molybdopterin-dependent oxidoreductase [Candidatus Hydrothermarchaeales archaeon]
MKRRNFIKGAAAATTMSLAGCLKQEGEEVVRKAPAAPDAKVTRTTAQAQCPYCGVGCATIIVAENGKAVGMIPDPDSPVNRGVQCVKGLTADEPLTVDRMTKVLIRKDMTDPITGHISATKGRFDDDVFREATWEEAEELAASKLAEIVEKSGGNSIGLYGSGQLTMETQYLENKLMKAILQSNTIEANARMCMTSAVTGYIKSLGSDTPPGAYEDIEKADMITFFAHNSREAHPIIFWRVADAKRKKDIPTVVCDYRRTRTVTGLENINPDPDKTIHLWAKPNAIISIYNAIAHVIIKDHPEAIDEDFIAKHTVDYDKFKEGVLARYSPEQVEEVTGIPPAQIRKVAKLWAEASIKGRQRGEGGVLAFWGIGFNQSTHGQYRVRSQINLQLMTGNMGRPGCGPFSMTGQPNAMSERLMGGLTGRLPFNEGMGNVAHRDKMAEAWGVSKERLAATAKEKNKGMAIGMFERAIKGEVKAMTLSYATHVDLPETDTLIRPALEKCFVIVRDAYRHAPNNLYADVIFPAATWGEWEGGVYQNSERRIYVVDGAAKPPENTRSDFEIVIDEGKLISEKLGLDPDKVFPYERTKNWQGRMVYDPEDVFREILRASSGTDADLTGILEVEERDGISPYDQLRQLRGISWPAPTYETAKQGGIVRRFVGQEDALWPDKPYGAFRRKDGKAQFLMAEQDFSRADEILSKLENIGKDVNFHAIDNYDVLIEIRDNGLPPEFPDFEYYDKLKNGEMTMAQIASEDKYPFWCGGGIVYEHFHSSKTIRGETTKRLVPEQYVEIHPNDAKLIGVKDGDWCKVTTPRGSYEARASVGMGGIVKPAANSVQEGLVFSPWNLNVADSADPTKNKWNINAASSRLFDPVSGQAEYKHSKSRVEKI